MPIKHLLATLLLGSLAMSVRGESAEWHVKASGAFGSADWGEAEEWVSPQGPREAVAQAINGPYASPSAFTVTASANPKVPRVFADGTAGSSDDVYMYALVVVRDNLRVGSRDYPTTVDPYTQYLQVDFAVKGYIEGDSNGAVNYSASVYSPSTGTTFEVFNFVNPGSYNEALLFRVPLKDLALGTYIRQDFELQVFAYNTPSAKYAFLQNWSDGRRAHIVDSNGIPVSGGEQVQIIGDSGFVYGGPGAGFLAADFDQDDDVDNQDLAVWRLGAGMASEATPAQGDADADGDVDGSDFLQWQRLMGQVTTADDVADVNLIPEPTSIFLAGMAISILRWGLTRHGRQARDR